MQSKKDLIVLVNQAISRLSADRTLHVPALLVDTTSQDLAVALSDWLHEERLFGVPFKHLPSGYIYITDNDQASETHRLIEFAVLFEGGTWQAEHMVYVSRKVPQRHIERLAKECLSSYLEEYAEEVVVNVAVIDMGEHD